MQLINHLACPAVNLLQYGINLPLQLPRVNVWIVFFLFQDLINEIDKRLLLFWGDLLAP